jgi:hypothetical protein
MDKAARAAQIARCVANTGDLITYQGSEPFAANIVPEPSEANPLTRDPGKVTVVRLSYARTALQEVSPAARPASGEYFTDAEGNRYRITKPLSHPLQPLAVFICTVSSPVT